MLTRGPKDSPDPCKAQGQPCTLRGTKGRVTGAQAQPWAWLCCESRPCRGGGGGVGAALAARARAVPGGTCRTPQHTSEVTRGWARRCRPQSAVSPLFEPHPWGGICRLPWAEAMPPRPVTLTQRLVLAPRVVGQRWLPAAGRGCEAESRGGWRGASGEPRCRRGPEGSESRTAVPGPGARMAVQPRVRPLPPRALRAARVPVHPFPASPPHSPVSPWPPVSWQPTRWWPLWG